MGAKLKVLTMSKKLIINDRFLDVMTVALSPKTRLLVGEGTIRSGKTVDIKNAFFEAVQDSDEEMHLIAAQDLDAINDNILDGFDGLLNIYPEYLKITRDEIGGFYIACKCDLPGRPREKKILLAGTVNSNKWKKILGKTLGVIMVDEVNTASEQFVDECFSRQTSANRPLTLWTMNGDVPTHWIYEKYINRCKIIGEAPASIRADMDKVQKEAGWYYMHFTMKHNPIMTPEKIEAASRIYPVGSYYYTIKILGERGAPGKLIYLDYLSEQLFKPFKSEEWFKYTIGVDIGAGRAKNSFSLRAFKHDNSETMVVDGWEFQGLGYEEKKKKLIAFCQMYKHLPITGIFIDSAEANFIRDIQGDFKRLGLPEVAESYKATIKERIDMNIVLFATKRSFFNSDSAFAKRLYQAYSIAKWVEGKEGEEREDKNEWLNDLIDSDEYAQTRYMKALMKASKEVI